MFRFNFSLKKIKSVNFIVRMSYKRTSARPHTYDDGFFPTLKKIKMASQTSLINKPEAPFSETNKSSPPSTSGENSKTTNPDNSKRLNKKQNTTKRVDAAQSRPKIDDSGKTNTVNTCGNVSHPRAPYRENADKSASSTKSDSRTSSVVGRQSGLKNQNNTNEDIERDTSDDPRLVTAAPAEDMTDDLLAHDEDFVMPMDEKEKKELEAAAGFLASLYVNKNNLDVKSAVDTENEKKGLEAAAEALASLSDDKNYLYVKSAVDIDEDVSISKELESKEKYTSDDEKLP